LEKLREGLFRFRERKRPPAEAAEGFESRSREPAGGSGEAGPRAPRNGGDEGTRGRIPSSPNYLEKLREGLFRFMALNDYDEAFFREWGPSNGPYVASAEIISGAIYEQFRPGTLADLGCGCGAYSHFLGRLGVRVTAIDGACPPAEQLFPVKIEHRDLENPCPHSGPLFDLALCLEVAEHIPEENCGVFLDNVISYSDLLLLSAAPPGQGGHCHVNERPKRYWVEKLAGRGFFYLRKETGRLVERCKELEPPYAWMWSQISVYRRLAVPPPEYGRPFYGTKRE